MNRFILIFLVLTFLTSCYSYKIFPKEYRSFTYTGEKLVFVINPELKKENDILRQSAIFDFTGDSSNEKCLKVKLQSIKKGFVCGQSIVASAFALGQFPVYLPDSYQYQFEEISKGDTTLKNFELLIAQRVWFWDMFVINKRFKQKAGKALIANYYKK